MQRDEWTFDGSVEVTVNIFSMHAFEFVVGKKIIEQTWPRNHMRDFKKYFSKKPTYESWKSSYGMALMTFAQLIRHFGWESMHKFMHEYEEDIKNDRDLPESNQEKLDQWVVRYSRIVGRNIRPQFEMFGLPVTGINVDEDLEGFELWSVEDEKDAKVFFAPLQI
jgi:hypothetical protein